MAYVLKRIPDGAYVARPGQKSSYTRKLEHAQQFPTRDAADATRCPENEAIVSVDSLFNNY